MRRYLFLSALSVLWSGAFSETCMAPTGQEGECMSIHNCTDIIQSVKQSENDEKLKNKLKLHHCGFTSDAPKVCCVTNVYNVQDKIFSTVVNDLDANQIDAVNEEDSSLPSSCGAFTFAFYSTGSPGRDEFPWLALIGYETQKGEIKYRCGGALINQRFVLTAAHCIVGSIQKEVGIIKTVHLPDPSAVVGTVCKEMPGGGKMCDEPARDVAVHVAVTQSGYRDDKDRRHDIGLIRLARRVKLSYFVDPICLDTAKDTDEIDGPVFISGWGASETEEAYKIKSSQSVTVVNTHICTNQYKEKSRIDGELSLNQICASGDNKNACQDSGGPLMKYISNRTWALVGVLSHGNGCGEDGLPGVYTKIANYIPGIQASIKKMNTENFLDVLKST